MSDSDRELRDRLEAAQSELKQAREQLAELETVASDRDVLHGQLASAQAGLKQATERLAELEKQSVETLEAELHAVTRDRDQMRQRLEQADKMREQWDGKLAHREAELAAARAEQWRLSEELANRPKPPPQMRLPRWLVLAVPLGTAVLGALLSQVGSCR